MPQPAASNEEILDRALEMVINTCPFDISGHPAMNIPCGVSDGLPVGLMAVGRRLSQTRPPYSASLGLSNRSSLPSLVRDTPSPRPAALEELDKATNRTPQVVAPGYR